jgi:hypothetical protein
LLEGKKGLDWEVLLKGAAVVNIDTSLQSSSNFFAAARPFQKL